MGTLSFPTTPTTDAVTGEATPFLFQEYLMKPATIFAVCYDDPAKALAIAKHVGGMVIEGYWQQRQTSSLDSDVIETEFVPNDPPVLLVPTFFGREPVGLGDYVVQGLTGHYSVCRAETFHRCYDPKHPTIILHTGDVHERGNTAVGDGA